MAADPVGYEEILRLRVENEQWEAEVQRVASQSVSLRSDLDKTRQQLLIVVAQRDALHAAMQQLKCRPPAEHAAARSKEDDIAMESLQRESALYKTEVQTAEQHRSVMSDQIAKHKQDMALLDRAIDEALRDSDIPPPPSGTTEKAHLLSATLGATRDKVASLETEVAALKQHVTFLSDKDTDQEVLLEGYHALQRKIAAEEGTVRHARVEGGDDAASRVEALQQQLQRLREENMRLMEQAALHEVHGGGGGGGGSHSGSPAVQAGTGAVLTALQLEISRLHTKLKGKKDTISKLRELLRQHIEGIAGGREAGAGSRAAEALLASPASHTPGVMRLARQQQQQQQHQYHHTPPAFNSPYAESRARSPTRLKW